MIDGVVVKGAVFVTGTLIFTGEGVPLVSNNLLSVAGA
jgi:hypothetical protein